MSGKSRKFLVALTMAALVLVWLAGPAAAEKPWWPFKVLETSTGKAKLVDYVPLQGKATKKWNIVALFPHLKDTSWLSANYGLVMEAKRQGVKLTILDAGGYDNLNKQVSQYDDAIQMGADAILTSVISEGGMSKKFKEGKEKGIINIGVINPIEKAPLDGKVYNDLVIGGQAAADVVLDEFKDQKKVRVLIFPGPAGSGWAEGLSNAFQARLKDKAPGKFEILREYFGDAGKSIQLKLVEDALQTYDNVDLLYGCNPMAEVAINVVKEAGLSGKTKIMASYETPGLLPAIRAGEVLGMVSEQNVAIARICLDMAVRALEKKPTGFGTFLQPKAAAITSKNIKSIPMDWCYAPEGFKPVFKVD